MRIEPRSDPMTTASPANGRQYPDEGNRETKPPLGSTSSVHPTGAAMKEQSDMPRQTPLVELLLAVPEDARLIYEHSPTESQSIPVGPMCRQAAMELATATRERDEARAEIERLITEVERLRGRLIGKRAIFQAGRDSYKTNCQPMNTDDEAWAEFVVSQEAKP